MFPWKTILAPTDFSAASNASVALAATIARTNGARLIVLNVVELHGGLSRDTLIHAPGASVPTTAGDFAREDAERHLAAQLETLGGGLEPEPEIVFGNAAESIVGAATRHNADVIVMGTHGRRGLVRALLGSVAERVVRTATVPVLTLPSPDAT